jgi:peroxiredoxin
VAFEIGERAAQFELTDTDGAQWSLEDSAGAGATVLAFTCNHCPYALAWHERLMDVARDYAGKGVRFAAINANDADRYPRDSPEAMRERVASEAWAMPYLFDATQEVAHAFDARTTPHLFVLDGDLRLRYAGAPDGAYDDPSQNAAWLRAAIDAVLAGGEASPAQTEPVGCSIKWRA